ncbi:MAG: electron transfer flavoprotein subunit beta/FixA family protein [Desulfuromonadales bacterium]
MHNSPQVLVLLRETCDPKPPVRLTADGYGIRERGLRRITNPADLSALEMALQLAAARKARVTVAAVGPARLDDHLRLALAMGADRALRVWDGDFKRGDAVADARILSRLIDVLNPELVLTGHRLLDRGDDPVPALAAAQRGIPCVPAALAVNCTGGTVEVLRKSDRGARQRIAAGLPGMLLVEAGCCDPRYPDQEQVLAALRRPIEVWGMPELGLSLRDVGEAGALLGRDRCSLPRPNPQRVVTPDASLPAFERILALLSGGIKPREGRVHALSAEETVDRLFEILAAEGLIREGSS